MFGLGKNNDTPSGASPTVAKTVKLVKDSGGGFAVPLDKIEQKAGLKIRKQAEIAGAALARKNLAGIRAQAVVVLDHSGSMSSDYRNGRVQELVERFLAFGLQIDVDGTIPVIPFDSKVYRTIDVTMDNYRDIVNQKIYKPLEMGSTNLAAALEEVRKIAQHTNAPVFCAIVTDGNPDSQSTATKLVCDLARYPVFIKFLALQKVSYLEDLDDLPSNQRLLDNVDAKFYHTISSVSDEDFARDMADEWDSWTVAATQAGILTA
jgi:hypothetical protein